MKQLDRENERFFRKLKWIRKNAGWIIISFGVFIHLSLVLSLVSDGTTIPDVMTMAMIIMFALLFYVPGVLVLGLKLRKTRPKAGLIMICVSAFVEILTIFYAVFVM